MVKTPHFHCGGLRFNPWSGKFFILSGTAKKESKKERERERERKITIFRVQYSYLST